MPRCVLPLTLVALAACHARTNEDDADTDAPAAFDAAGPHAVGTTRFSTTDDVRSRTLNVQVWYPAADSARADADAGFPMTTFGVGDEVATLEGLLDSALGPGTLRVAHAAVDGAPLPGESWPLVMFSHCLDCTRFSTFPLAEQLASHGFAVMAADHAGGTLYDRLAGDSAALGAEFLDTRAADVSFLIDRALTPDAPEVPEVLRGRFDADRVGMYGHSFGGITTGRVLMLDDRPKSGLSFGAPMENPLTPGVTLADLHVPLMFVVATEDNSITEVGNLAIRNNFAAANAPVWKVEIADAGHYAFTAICGIIPDFGAGCATGDVRQTDGSEFTYLDIDRVRGLSSAWATAFFSATLNGDAAASDWLSAPPADAAVTVESRVE